MRPLLITITLCFVFITCNAQELKKKRKSGGDPIRNQTYYVLKTDKSIRHGEYVSKTPGGKLVTQGYYNYGKKDSIWTEYYINPNTVQSICRYQDDIPKLLLVNDQFSRIKYIYDYSQNQLTEYHWYDEPNKSTILIEDEWVDKEVDNPPILIGVIDPYEVIMECFKLPYEVGQSTPKGTAIIGFIIDEFGKRGEARLIQGFNVRIDKELLKCANLLDTNWYPAYKDGNAVACNYILSIDIAVRKVPL